MNHIRHAAALCLFALFLDLIPMAVFAADAPARPAQTAQGVNTGAILGYYDPVSGSFKPLESVGPDVVADYDETINFTPKITFSSGNPKQYTSLSCLVSATYSSSTGNPNSYYGNATNDYTAGAKASTISLHIKFQTGESSPKLNIVLQCTGYDFLNTQHQFSEMLTIPAKSGTVNESPTIVFPS